MVSAVGQGALGIVCRSGDDSTREAVQELDHIADPHSGNGGTRTPAGARRQLPDPGCRECKTSWRQAYDQRARRESGGSRVIAEELTAKR